MTPLWQSDKCAGELSTSGKKDKEQVSFDILEWGAQIQSWGPAEFAGFSTQAKPKPSN